MRNWRRRSTTHLCISHTPSKRNYKKQYVKNEFKENYLKKKRKSRQRETEEEETMISRNVVCPILCIISCIESNRTLFAFSTFYNHQKRMYDLSCIVRRIN